MSDKKRILSITKKDFNIEFTRGSGNGGQNKNKVETACRITHRESGAVGYSETERTQFANKKIAFDRLVRSEKFKKWHKVRIAWALQGVYDIEKEIERIVDEMMRPSKIKCEIRVDDKWVEVDPDWFEANKDAL